MSPLVGYPGKFRSCAEKCQFPVHPCCKKLLSISVQGKDFNGLLTYYFTLGLSLSYLSYLRVGSSRVAALARFGFHWKHVPRHCYPCSKILLLEREAFCLLLISCVD